MTEGFVEFARRTLIEKLGDSGEDLFTRVLAKKPVSDKSSSNEILEFIKAVEHITLAMGGQEKATEIGVILQNKVRELGKPTAVSPIEKEKVGSLVEKENVGSLVVEIEDFLKRHDLPTEMDILDYTKYLTLKYGGNAKKVEKDIIEKVKIHVKDGISRKKINEEMSNFLTKFPQPTEKDVDDFVNYIRFLKIDFPGDELRDLVEKERLYRKFHGEEVTEEKTPLDQFIETVKPLDKKELGKAMLKQGVGYLIKDEKGISDNLVSEYAELLTPSETDAKATLEGLGLKHMIKKKN